VERDDPTNKNDVLLTERSGNVLVLTLNRPEARNALNPELKDQLIDAIHGACSPETGRSSARAWT
jgi:enoyl-CoA hydratase/carnithine racemase